jgi:hypothetical protein
MRALAVRQARRLGLAMVVTTLLVRVEVGLRRSTLPELCHQLGLGFEGSPGGPSGMAPGHGWLRRRMTAVDRLVTWWPFGDTCLRRCLVLGVLLRRCGPTLVIGVRGSGASLEAHSWLEVGGRSLDPLAQGFVRLSS